MGVCFAREPSQYEKDLNALSDFLHQIEGPNGCLDNVWFRFDKDRTGFMTKKEFRYLLFVALSLFCRARDPTINHSKKTMEPFILKLQQDLLPRIDVNADGRISRDEFRAMGVYLLQEQKKLERELAGLGAEEIEGGLPAEELEGRQMAEEIEGH